MRMLVCRLKGAVNRGASLAASNGPRRFGHSEGYGGSDKLWERLTYFVAFPAIGLAMLNVYLDDHDHGRPEFIKYDYLRIMTKRFPWGDGKKSFFFNPKVNATPDGYVDE